MVYPDFFDDFECKASACRHSCCRGWEIDVDEDTADYYRSIEDDAIGDELRASLYKDEDGSHFVLTDEEKCPFLRDDGLCRLILTLGEAALCDICALHPRFYEEYDNKELCGLGLSCERVCELLWESGSKLMFADDEGVEFSFEEQALSYEPDISEERVIKLLQVFGETEPIDEAWVAEINTLKENLPEVIRKAGEYLAVYDRGRYDRLFHYLMYRQLERGLGDGLSAYGRFAADFIFITDAYFGDTPERIRRFSEQIEYSTENVDVLLDV